MSQEDGSMPCDRPVNVLLYLLFYYCAKLYLLLLCHWRIKFLLLSYCFPLSPLYPGSLLSLSLCSLFLLLYLPIVVRQPSPSWLPPSASVLTHDTYFTKAAASVHPLHVNSNPSPLDSAHVFPHPELTCCIQLPQYPNTRCLLATTCILLSPTRCHR